MRKFEYLVRSCGLVAYDRTMAARRPSTKFSARKTSADSRVARSWPDCERDVFWSVPRGIA